MEETPASLYPIYRPGRDRALLGGDFFDAIATDGGCRLHLLIGDVCGHGVDEAPLGVALRVAWRALVLANVPDEAVLQSLEQVLSCERRSEEHFATVAAVTVDLDANVAEVRLAGHPPPILISEADPGPADDPRPKSNPGSAGEGTVVPCDVEPGLVLGVLPGLPRPATRVPLGEGDWSLLLYTDGLIEGRVDNGERLGVEGLCRLLAARPNAAAKDLPAWLVGQAEERNGGPLADDVAVLLLTPRGGAAR